MLLIGYELIIVLFLLAEISHTDNKIFLQSKGNQAVGRQTWKRSKADANGWFTFEDPKSGLVLTANSSLKNPTIEGICNKYFY